MGIAHLEFDVINPVDRSKSKKIGFLVDLGGVCFSHA